MLPYGGSLTGSQASFSRTPLFGNARQKGGALAKIIHAEITHNNVKGPPMFQELVADTFWSRSCNLRSVQGKRYIQQFTSSVCDHAWTNTENWLSCSLCFGRKGISARKHVDQNKDSDAVTYAFSV